jgi:hypothetical protein
MRTLSHLGLSRGTILRMRFRYPLHGASSVLLARPIRWRSDDHGVNGHVLTAKGRAASGPRSISPRRVDDWTFGHSAVAALCRHHLKYGLEPFEVRDFAPDFAQLLRQRFD